MGYTAKQRLARRQESLQPAVIMLGLPRRAPAAAFIVAVARHAMLEVVKDHTVVFNCEMRATGCVRLRARRIWKFCRREDRPERALGVSAHLKRHDPRSFPSCVGSGKGRRHRRHRTPCPLAIPLGSPRSVRPKGPGAIVEDRGAQSRMMLWWNVGAAVGPPKRIPLVIPQQPTTEGGARRTSIEHSTIHDAAPVTLERERRGRPKVEVRLLVGDFDFKDRAVSKNRCGRVGWPIP